MEPLRPPDEARATAAAADGVRIRTATAGDAAVLAALLGQLGYPSTEELVVARLGRMGGDPGQQVLVAEVDGVVVGMATLFLRHLINTDAPLARLSSMVVDEARRGRGIGEQLVAAAEGRARAAGCDRMEVTSHERRARAHAFYLRLGYQERPRRFVKAL